MFEAMNEFGVDTLKAARALEAAGFEAAQAETLVTVFHGFAAGHGATRGQVRDLESTFQEFQTDINSKLEELRTEVTGEIAKLHLSVEGLKTRMYQLLLGQVVLIVGLIVSLDRLL